MTALGKLFRTTTFKLTLVYLTFFLLFAVFLLGYFAWNTRRLINDQIIQIIDTETSVLSEQYRAGGIGRLAIIIDNRSRRPGSNLYLLTTYQGQSLAGNVGWLSPGALDRNTVMEARYRRLDDEEGPERHALVRVYVLQGAFRLLVGRDLEERERLYDVVMDAGRWSLAIVIVLGLAGGFFVTRRVLKRIDAMTGTTQTIIAGDLTGRLPIAGTGDELDRLAENLNAMLERIEALMHGLKEVSDNIAHDLKTPLTRLRNRAEQALRIAKSDADYRTALESTIEESDGLIATFNALLMIARAESGHARENMSDFDAAEVARDVAELYEPLADEKGLSVKLDAPHAVPMHGNHELISQALANLLDNAIKYAAPDQRPSGASGGNVEIVVAARNGSGRVELSVSDHGPGIPEADRERAVERFVRLEQSRSAPGSGLGLSLANAVARLHGGELELKDNRPGLTTVIAVPLGNGLRPSGQ